jgi:hypothetical protein
MKKNRYHDSPSRLELIVWAILLGGFFWLLFFGFVLIIRGIEWAESFITGML